MVHHEDSVKAGCIGFSGLAGNHVEEIGGVDAGIREAGYLIAEAGHRVDWNTVPNKCQGAPELKLVI
jgi:hypothetical protein